MTEEMPREDGPRAVPEERIPPAAISREDGRRAGTQGTNGEDLDRSFSPYAPIRFAVHALFYYAGRSADRIISLYSRAFRLDRGYVADFNKSSGIALAGKGQWRKAIPLLEKALAMDPRDRETRMHLAEAYEAANQYDKAHLHLEKILEESPDSARALRALGIIHSRRQDYEQAIEFLERAVELDPDHAQAFYRLGAAYDHRKQYDQAVQSFRKAIGLDPRSARAYQALGFTYESLGDHESAIECFKKALEFE